MLICNGKIEYYPDIVSVTDIIIDVSQNMEHFAILLDALEFQLIKKINIKGKNNEAITVSIRTIAEFLADSCELRITIDQVMTIKKIICDVVIGNAFSGYHLDFEIPSKNGIINVCLIVS